MRHFLVSSGDDGLADRLRPLLPPDTVVLSACGVDDTLERLARSFRVDAVVTDDPAVVEAIREEVPGDVSVLLVPEGASPEEAVGLLEEVIGDG